MKENIKDWIKTVSTAVVSAMIIMQFVVPTNVYGGSMEPTFLHKDYLLISRQAYAGRRVPQRGDIIVFESELKDENGSNKVLIKRVIGLPGDRIAVNSGRVYINGKLIEEDYLKDDYTTGKIMPMKVPEGQYFCMGDNRVRSRDSRDVSVGTIHEDKIIGKVFFRVYPFKKLGKIGDEK